MKVYSIGSVIGIDEIKYMIIGHFSKEIEEKVKYYYICVPYPRGYVGKDKTMVVSFEANFNVIYESESTERGKDYLMKLEKVANFMLNASDEEIWFYTNLAKEAVKSIE